MAEKLPASPSSAGPGSVKEKIPELGLSEIDEANIVPITLDKLTPEQQKDLDTMMQQAWNKFLSSFTETCKGTLVQKYKVKVVADVPGTGSSKDGEVKQALDGRRSRLLSPGQPSVSWGNHRRRVLAGKTVALPPLYRLQPPVPPCRCSGCCHRHPPSTSPRRPPPRLSLGFAGTPSPASVSPSASPEFLRQPLPPCPCASRRRHLLLRHRSVKVALGHASPPSEPRLCSLSSSPLVVVDDSSGRSFVLAGSSSRCAATLVVIVAACSAPSSSLCSCCRLPSSPPRRFLSSSSRRSRSSCRSSLRQAVLVRRPRPSSVPLQPRRRLRPRLRVAKRCASRVSPSSKDRRRSRPLAFRLRHSRPSLPRPFVVVVPSPRRVVVRISPSLPRPRHFGVARARCAVVDPGTRVPVSVVVRLCVW
ncbi:uncharacterized protein [Oryza sativa Japonica Group]|uniref:uncharacterized protein n=1 Tax=Oryza sativa subsp. japonica TaxID=39947 RepID=UPI00339C08A6